MGDALTPDDYDADDGWSDDNGIEMCPHCGTMLSPNGGHVGPVFTQGGREYDTIYETDPGDCPFFCPDCFKELDANRKAGDHRTLGEFA